MILYLSQERRKTIPFKDKKKKKMRTTLVTRKKGNDSRTVWKENIERKMGLRCALIEDTR